MMSRLDDAGGFGPPMTGGSAGDGLRRWLKPLFVTGCAVMAVVLTVGTINLAVLWQGVGSVDRVPVGSTADIAVPLATDAPPSFAPVDVEPVGERTTVLLVGSDSREGLSEAELAAIGTTDHGSDLTDTIILLQLDGVTDTARMISFPRDLWVEHCDGRAGRINAAMATGESVLGEGMGPSCLVTTVETMTGIGIDHYARIDFAGFVQAVDAVGGVTFHVDEPMRDPHAGLDIPAGCVDFDGITAIQFVRARHLDSDLGRVARQQRFALELVDEVASLGTLTNPARLQRLVGSIAGALQTDDDLGAGELLDLARGLNGLSSEGVVADTLPVVDERIDGQAVLVAVPDQAEALYAAFQAGPDAADTQADEAQPAATDEVTTEADSGGLTAGERDDLSPGLSPSGVASAGAGGGTPDATPPAGEEEAPAPPSFVGAEQSTQRC